MTDRTYHKAVLMLIGAISVGATNGYAQEAEDSDITMAKSESVKISDVDDWFVGAFGPDDTIATRQGNFDFICVHSTSGLYNFNLTSTHGGSTDLILESSAGDQMQYLIVAYSYTEGANRAFPDDRREFQTPFSLDRRLASPTVSCVGQGFQDANLFLAAAVDPAAFNAAPPGIYQDTVIMTVSAE